MHKETIFENRDTLYSSTSKYHEKRKEAVKNTVILVKPSYIIYASNSITITNNTKVDNYKTNRGRSCKD